MTPRKERGLEIFERKQQLRARQSGFDRERTRIFTETGQKVSGQESQVSEEERPYAASCGLWRPSGPGCWSRSLHGRPS